MTYTRAFGRGYTLDDPDMISSLAMMSNSMIYLIYNVQINLSPELYETNTLYKYADIMGFIDALFCVVACLRDDYWFWFLPLSGQYGIPFGRINVESKTIPQFGRKPVLLDDIFSIRLKTKSDADESMFRRQVITVPIFAPANGNVIIDQT